jgi:hypothetical protein
MANVVDDKMSNGIFFTLIVYFKTQLPGTQWLINYYLFFSQIPNFLELQYNCKFNYTKTICLHVLKKIKFL